MSRKRKPQIGEAFVPILKHMINSQAFKNLTNPARVAYLLLKAQCNKFGQNEVKYPYSHAEVYMDKKTFNKAIKQLIENGFIEKSCYGGLYRRTNVYKFVDNWRKITPTKQEEILAYSIRGVEKHRVEPLNTDSNNGGKAPYQTPESPRQGENAPCQWGGKAPLILNPFEENRIEANR